MKKFGQRLGEGVRLYKKTEEEEDFVQYERIADTTRDATDRLVKCLAPKSGPKNRAKKLVKSGEKMQDVDKYNSVFGKGVACLGAAMKNLGQEHAELENRVQIYTINPLKSYRDGDLKEIMNLKKRYDSNRLDYDSSRRTYQSKSTPDNEDKMRRAKNRYEEARDAYYEKLQHSQDEDHEHVGHLKAYARSMIEYHRKSMEVFEESLKELESISPSSRPSSRKGFSSVGLEDEKAAVKLQSSPMEPMPQRTPPMMVQQPFQPHHPHAQPMASAPFIHQQQQQTYRGGPPDHTDMQAQTASFSSCHQSSQIGSGHHAIMPMKAEPPAMPPRQRPPPGPRPIERCRALYDFDPGADVPNGIPIKQGDIITVLSKTPSGWWEGEVRGQLGFFPSNYVQPLF